MEAREKRRFERERQTKARREEIIDAAVHEFISSGIDNARIVDIAKRAEVGPATVYRYFETKSKLVVECATKLWNSEMQSLESQIESARRAGETGYGRVKALLGVMGALYEKCPVGLRLLEQFDNYVEKENVPRRQLTRYEEGIFKAQAFMLDAIRAGQEDGSIRTEVNGKNFCVTATHAITALSQKLLLRGDVVESDRELDAGTQLRLLVDMELRYLSAAETWEE